MIPVGQKVSGQLSFNVRIVMHDNPGRLTRVDVYDSGSGGLGRVFSANLSESCPFNGTVSTNCAFEVPVTLDTTEMKDGWRELRVRANVTTPDDQRFFSSSGIPIFANNGNERIDYKRSAPTNDDNTQTHIAGRGWYEGSGYTNAWIANVPQTVVRGTHRFLCAGAVTKPASSRRA